MSAQQQGADLDYVVHISRGSGNVATQMVQADSDAQAFDLAIEWAASLLLAADDDVVLAIRLPSGTFKTFSRKDFWRRSARRSIPGREMAARRAMIERIVIEIETPGDARTMFRVLMDNLVIGQNLTAAQAYLIVGEVLDRITLPRPTKSFQSSPNRPAVRRNF
jgi:hypothetical protein